MILKSFATTLQLLVYVDFNHPLSTNEVFGNLIFFLTTVFLLHIYVIILSLYHLDLYMVVYYSMLKDLL